ncbi:MAG: hypothetical protein ABIM43_04340 [candidate division WOR-3 bacterium]
MWWIKLMIFGLTIGGNFKSIEVEQEQPKKFSKYGDVVVTIGDFDSVFVSNDNSCEITSGDSILKINLRNKSMVEIRVPANLSYLEVSSVTGDLKVIYESEFRGERVDVSSVTGNVEIQGKLTGILEAETVSGNIKLDVGVSDLTVPVKANLSTVTGRISLEKFVPGKFKLETLTGSIYIGEKVGFFSDTLYNYEISTLTGGIHAPKEIKDLLTIEKATSRAEPRVHRKREHYFDKYPELEFNRTVGLLIPVMFKEVEEWGKYNVGAAYGTASKRVYYYVDVEKFLLKGALQLGVGITMYDQVLNSEPWKVSVDENSWQMLLLKDDLFDYYRAKGVRIYTELEKGPIGIRPSFNYEERFPEIVRTDFSVFKRDKVVRNNPYFDSGLFTYLGGDLKAGPLKIRGEYYIRNGTNGKGFRVFGTLEKKKESKNLKLLGEVDFGYTNLNGFPNEFSLGGVTTLPGYSTNSIKTQKFVIVQEYIIFPTKVVDFVVGAYGGYANNKFYGDLLAGLNIFKGLGVYITHDRENDKLKYYLRFEAKI